MPALRIPSEHQKGLLKLFDLSTEQTESFLKSLKAATERVRSDKLSSADLQGTSGIASEDLDNMLDMILAMYHVRNYADVSVEEFISDVIESIEDKKRELIETKKLPAIKERLAAFLGIDGLNVWAKASVLRYEHERTLHDLRILTDARPVFGEDVSVPPRIAVIFHMLKIEYHAPKGTEEIYFSLDEDDLEYLKQAITRAEEKAKSLRQALANSHITTINPS